eukprot:5118997-Pyramimonas_sp.AAC.1
MDIARHTIRFQLVSAHFPHSGYKDYNVERIYDTIVTTMHEARQNRRHIVPGADCNAKAGYYEDGYIIKTVG